MDAPVDHIKHDETVRTWTVWGDDREAVAKELSYGEATKLIAEKQDPQLYGECSCGALTAT